MVPRSVRTCDTRLVGTLVQLVGISPFCVTPFCHPFLHPFLHPFCDFIFGPPANSGRVRFPKGWVNLVTSQVSFSLRPYCALAAFCARVGQFLFTLSQISKMKSNTHGNANMMCVMNAFKSILRASTVQSTSFLPQKDELHGCHFQVQGDKYLTQTVRIQGVQPICHGCSFNLVTFAPLRVSSKGGRATVEG